jgi:hypothetical protein
MGQMKLKAHGAHCIAGRLFLETHATISFSCLLPHDKSIPVLEKERLKGEPFSSAMVFSYFFLNNYYFIIFQRSYLENSAMRVPMSSTHGHNLKVPTD